MQLLKYLQEVKSELAHVTWPTRAQAQGLTTVVLCGSLIVGLYIGSLDYLFTNLLGIFLK